MSAIFDLIESSDVDVRLRFSDLHYILEVELSESKMHFLTFPHENVIACWYQL
jgi:hypothetical protein